MHTDVTIKNKNSLSLLFNELPATPEIKYGDTGGKKNNGAAGWQFCIYLVITPYVFCNEFRQGHAWNIKGAGLVELLLLLYFTDPPEEAQCKKHKGYYYIGIKCLPTAPLFFFYLFDPIDATLVFLLVSRNKVYLKKAKICCLDCQTEVSKNLKAKVTIFL